MVIDHGQAAVQSMPEPAAAGQAQRGFLKLTETTVINGRSPFMRQTMPGKVEMVFGQFRKTEGDGIAEPQRTICRCIPCRRIDGFTRQAGFCSGQALADGAAAESGQIRSGYGLRSGNQQQ